jgi:riboflavin biosynthesis pyrimidine reductase
VASLRVLACHLAMNCLGVTHAAIAGRSESTQAGSQPLESSITRPLPDPPPGVEARSGGMAGVAAELEGRGHRRVWIEGGGRVIRSMIAIGKLDVLELALVPTILGEGVPLFPSGTGELRLHLVKCEAKAKGALHLVYERAA